MGVAMRMASWAITIVWWVALAVSVTFKRHEKCFERCVRKGGSMVDATHIAITGSIIIGIASYTTWWYLRIRSMVKRWAAHHEVQLLDFSILFLPSRRAAWVILGSSRNQVVVQMRVYDDKVHRIRNGLLRLGSFWWGLMNVDAVEVFWADQEESSSPNCF
jgi:hypothetical protein